MIAVSVYLIVGRAREGAALSLPLTSHLLALLAVATEIFTRALKITWSAKAVRIELPLWVSTKITVAGDFGGSITPARSGAEPARFMVLAESGIPASSALVVLFAELFLEMLSLAAVVVLVAVLFHDAGRVLAALVGVVGMYAAFVLGVGAIAIVLARRQVGDEPPPWAARLHLGEKRWQRLGRGLGKVRETVAAVRNVHPGWAIASFVASFVHVAMRLCVLPALVLPVAPGTPLTPLALWPLGLLYGAAVVPAPGGGGAVELAFRAALGSTIPAAVFPAALLWWRVYTFYLYIVLGALVAGGVVLRAVRKTEDVEDEFVEST